MTTGRINQVTLVLAVQDTFLFEKKEMQHLEQSDVGTSAVAELTEKKKPGPPLVTGFGLVPQRRRKLESSGPLCGYTNNWKVGIRT